MEKENEGGNRLAHVHLENGRLELLWEKVHVGMSEFNPSRSA